MSTEQDTQRPSWLTRQLVGTGIITAMGAAGGAAYSLYKGNPLPKGIKSGSIIALVGSLGFGGMAYDAAFGKKPSFQERIETERANDAPSQSHTR
jgi:hypothetical protein